jgi:hypothetical protein
MDEQKVRKWLHELNNHVAVVLNNAEMMLQVEQLSPRGLERTKQIEAKALEIRQLTRTMADHLTS